MKMAYSFVKVCFLVAIITYQIWGVYFFSPTRMYGTTIGKLHVNLVDGRFNISTPSERVGSLYGIMGIDSITTQPQPCAGDIEFRTHKGVCAEWPGAARLEVSVDNEQDESLKCYKVKWTPLSFSYRAKDCFLLNGSHWFGGAEMYNQKWPSDTQKAPMQTYTSQDYLAAPDEMVRNRYGSILEPYWISSSGIGIHVDSHVMLHASLNENSDEKLCLMANELQYSTSILTDMPPELSYSICTGGDIKEVHKHMFPKYFDKPENIPDELMFRSPIWSTWARYKTWVNQSDVIEYAKEIIENNFTNSQIEIDDMYTTTYGDLDFDLKKFPFPRRMVKTLNEMGFRVTSWVTPFMNWDSRAFADGAEKGYFVKDPGGKAPALVRWWQGQGAVLDVTNPDATDWYIERLEMLRDGVGLESFKFDAGEVGFLPLFMSTHAPLTNPNEYTTKYAEVVSRLGPAVEMRSASRSQRHPMFTRMMDKDSVWGYNNGLQTLIPTALLMGFLGYQFILPDMIGGNGYTSDDPLHSTLLPDRELFIRWVQVTAYFQSMQLSVAPWQYDQEVVDISREMVGIHEEVVTPLVINAAKDAIKTGMPIIRPLWWLDPKDEDSLVCDSEFMVADDLLVAPILCPGCRARDIYLPNGKWEDQLRGQTHHGRTWLRNYEINLNEIATFKRISE